MLTQGEDVEVHALRRRGWSVSAIARHLGRDRKTVRAYLRGERQPGVRASAALDPLALFVPYLAARFTDDPHLWASALYDEVVPLGYGLSYVSFAMLFLQRFLGPVMSSLEPSPLNVNHEKAAAMEAGLKWTPDVGPGIAGVKV